MTASSTGYGRISFAVADAGGFASMTRADAITYLLLAAHADAEWRARPGVARLAALGGFTARSVKRALASLERKGLIRVETRGGGRGRATVYKLENSDTPATLSVGRVDQKGDSGVTVSGGERVTRGARKGDSRRPKGCQPAPKRVTHGARKGDTGARKGDTGVTPTDLNRSEQTTEQGPASRAAAGNLGEDQEGQVVANTRALAHVGVGSPKREEVALLPGVTHSLIESTAATVNGSGGGAGLIVRRIEEASRHFVQAGEQRKARNAALDEERQRRRKEIAESKERLQIGRETIEDLDAEQCERLVAQALDTMPAAARRAVGACRDPLKSRILGANVLRLLQGVNNDES